MFSSPQSPFLGTFRFARRPSAGITYSPTCGLCSPMRGMAGPIFLRHRIQCCVHAQGGARLLISPLGGKVSGPIQQHLLRRTHGELSPDKRSRFNRSMQHHPVR